MLRVTEDLCDAMAKYNIRPKLPFRYIRGGTYSYLERAIVAYRGNRQEYFNFLFSVKDH